MVRIGRRQSALLGLLLAVSVAFGVAIARAEAATPTLTAQSSSATVGQTVPVPIVLSEAPSGISGFDLVVTLGNSAVASIIDVSFPNSGLSQYTLISSSQVRIRAADLNGLVQAGATNATLATLNIKALKVGTTEILVQVFALDDDDGSPVAAQVATGVLSVKKANGSGGSGSGRGRNK